MEFQTLPLNLCMNVNEQKIIKHYTSTQIKVKEQHFYCCSTFHSHSRIFNNEHNSYPCCRYDIVLFNQILMCFFVVVEWIVLSVFSIMLTDSLYQMPIFFY